jgi:hypothetical protein
MCRLAAMTTDVGTECRSCISDGRCHGPEYTVPSWLGGPAACDQWLTSYECSMSTFVAPPEALPTYAPTPPPTGCSGQVRVERDEHKGIF